MASSSSRGARSATAAETWTPPYCTIVAVDTTDFSYRSCALCERALPDHGAACPTCSLRGPSPPTTRLYRLLLSIGTPEKVVVVVLFDRAARALLGCPADELARFFTAHPSAAGRAGEILQGEMCRMALRASKKGNAEHLRAVTVAPLRAGFRPVIETLRTLYFTAGTS